jgi:hypothetical protein
MIGKSKNAPQTIEEAYKLAKDVLVDSLHSSRNRIWNERIRDAIYGLDYLKGIADIVKEPTP